MEAHQKFIADVHGTTGRAGEEHAPDDYPRIRELTLNKVRDAAVRRFPLENERHRLELTDVDYEDLKPYTLAEQKRAILEGRSLYKRLKGRWRLVDKESGREVSKTNRTTVMRVPWLTDRGTYVRNGHEEVLANQMRLVPGVFARKRDDGTPEAHVNVKQGSGRLFKVRMDPATGVFTMNVGNKNLKLYPIMRSLGVPDKELEKAWGKQILTNNIEAAAGAVSKRSLKQFAKTAVGRDSR